MKIIKKVIDKKVIKDEKSEYPMGEGGLRYGYYYENYNDVWNENELQENLEKFFNNNFGKISEAQRKRNLLNQEKEAGDMVGIYSKGNDHKDDMVIYYDDTYKIVYALLRTDFELPKEAWFVGEEKYTEEYPRVGAKLKYGEYGHTLNKAQKESLRETWSGKNESKELDEGVAKEALHYGPNATVHESEIVATKKAIEKNFGEDMVNQLKELANTYNVDYDDVVEKVAEENIVNQKNLENSIKTVIKNAKKPYYFTDSAFGQRGNETTELEKEIFTPKEQKLYECDEDGYCLNSHDQLHHCGWCKEIYPESEMKNEVDFGWLCDRCQDELHYHGGKLMFIEDAEFDPREDEKEKKRLLSTRYNQFSIANILANWLPEMTYDIDEGNITSKEFAQKAIELVREQLNTPYVNEKFIPSITNILNKPAKNDYYTLSELLRYFWNIILKTEGEGVIKLKNSKFDSVKKQLQDSINKLSTKDEKPAWLEEELIDDIVYSKEWPTTIKEVAEALMKYGIKNRHEAIGYVKEYLNDNPAELKHFKTTKDSKVKKDSKKIKDFDKFLTHTKEDYEVLKIYQNDNGRLFAIIYRPTRQDYLVAAGYNIKDGYWDQGYYDFFSQEIAEKFLFNKYDYEDLDIYWSK